VKTPKIPAICACLLLCAGVIFAVSATWKSAPSAGDGDLVNWSANVPPETNVSLSDFASRSGFTFPAASAFTIRTKSEGAELSVGGAGIGNDLGITQNVIAGNETNQSSSRDTFTSAAAGNLTNFPNFTTSGSVAGGHRDPVIPANPGSATWNATPSSGDWNDAANWSAGGPPNTSADTATFASSNTTTIFLSAATTVGSIVFNASASAFTITTNAALTLTITGAGVTNNSGITQNFVTDLDVGGNPGFIVFNGTGTTAGSLTTFTNKGNTVGGFGSGGQTEFRGSSTAGSATFINNGGTDNLAGGGVTTFMNSSNAGSGTFTNNAGTVANAFGGFTNFLGISDAMTATLTSNGATVNGANGGRIAFQVSSTANAATLIATSGSNGGLGGTISFGGASTGGTTSVQVFGNGNLDIGLHDAPGVTIGSLEGTGKVFLSNRNLSVGSNNSSTTFSGVIQDGGEGGFTGGSLTKIGTGTLTLTGVNTFSGGVTMATGILAAGVGSLVSISGTITVNSGGTLMLSGVGQHIGVNLPMTLNGGTFDTNGLSEGSPGFRGIGALTLTATSTINFGAGASSVIEFGGIGTHTASTILQIINWNGVPVTGGSGDRLLFQGFATAFASAYGQNDVSFNGATGYDLIQFNAFGDNPYFEVTSLTPVPEPGTWLAGALVLGVLGWTQRRRLARLRRSA